jgi:hypothetical protein
VVWLATVVLVTRGRLTEAAPCCKRPTFANFITRCAVPLLPDSSCSCGNRCRQATCHPAGSSLYSNQGMVTLQAPRLSPPGKFMVPRITTCALSAQLRLPELLLPTVSCSLRTRTVETADLRLSTTLQDWTCTQQLPTSSGLITTFSLTSEPAASLT